MVLNKPSGNMYPWAFTWNPLMGECPHKCVYCYVSKKIAPMLKKYGNEKYYGELRIDEKALKNKLVIDDCFVLFVQSCGDLFAEKVPSEWIHRILDYCKKFPETTYLFQTKNPERFMEFIYDFPPKFILGTTMETNRNMTDLGEAPTINERLIAILRLPISVRRMISIEPVIEFDTGEFVQLIGYINPEFVSIGADSKNTGLPEPSKESLVRLISLLNSTTEVRTKKNLERLMK